MTNIKTQRRFDDIYKNTPLGEIPWNHEKPPEPLVDLVNSGEIKPCRALDLGCGAGNYAVYLASCGFEVTAIDISPAAVKIAKKSRSKKVSRAASSSPMSSRTSRNSINPSTSSTTGVCCTISRREREKNTSLTFTTISNPKGFTCRSVSTKKIPVLKEPEKPGKAIAKPQFIFRPKPG